MTSPSEGLGRSGPWIQTRSGVKFYYYTAGQSDIRLLDIATGLSQTCRWAAQSKEFYSVAQHSVLLSLLAPTQMALYALLHDAHEAYLGDMPTPLKRAGLLGKHYDELANRIQSIIEDTFEVPEPEDVELFNEFDSRMAASEAEVLCVNNFSDDDGWLIHSKPLNVRINPWTAENSKHAFIKRFKDLNGRREEGKFVADSGMYF